MIKLSVIIPIYNIDPLIVNLTNRCLESIKKYTKDYEIIVVDNKNGEQWEKDADIYIKNEKNNGNGLAWQQGAKVANGEYICFMDNDVEVSENWSEPLIGLLQDKKVAVAFPLSKNKEDDDYFERLAGFCWIIRRDLFYKINNSIEKGYRIQDWGLANFEDTSFYMSCKLKRYELRCSNESKVHHWSRATTGKVKKVDELYPKNEKKYFDKYKVLPLLD